MKIVYIGGEPATGKTTLMKSLLKELYPGMGYAYGKVKGIFFPQGEVRVLGIYDSEKPFAGTDRLSMTVITDALKFLEEKKGSNETWLLEGDRLFNKSFLKAAKAAGELKIFVLEVDSKIKHERHIQRGDTQSETWLKSRATKVQNLLELFPEAIKLQNDNPESMAANLEQLKAAIKK